MAIESKSGEPEFPFFGESLAQFRRWYFASPLGPSLPNEDEVKHWRMISLRNIMRELRVFQFTDRNVTMEAVELNPDKLPSFAPSTN